MMENCIISDFQRLHVLPTNELCPRRKIDDLVPDLIQALEESSSSSHYKHRKRGFKRRAKFVPSINLPKVDLSDELDSSQGENAISNEKVMDSLQQSDSDDMSPSGSFQKSSCLFKFPAILQESDSFNETFSPVRPHTRRKNRFKRMTVDSAVHSLINMPLTSKSHCKILQKDGDKKSFSRSFSRSGKRKRSFRDNADLHRNSLTACCLTDRCDEDINTYQKMVTDDFIDDDSCSSLSNDSENGFMTTDEGREADDEQSDWFHEPGPTYGVPGIKVPIKYKEDDSDDTSPNPGKPKRLQKSLLSPFKGQRCPDSPCGREILSGRRQLKEDKLSIETSRPLLEKVDQFLQDPSLTELKLGHVSLEDHDKLIQFAEMFSLRVYESGINGDTFLLKSKIGNHLIEPSAYLGGGCSSSSQLCSVPTGSFKKRRKFPPCLPHSSEGMLDQL